MKKSSLKRMLEAAESSTHESRTKHDDSKVSVDLYDLPSTLPAEEIEKVINGIDSKQAEINTPDQVKQLLALTSDCFERNRNQRLQHKDDPSGFMESEVELDIQIKRFHAVILDEELVNAFLTSGGPELFAELLNHPNEDICVEVIRVLEEFTRESKAGLELVSSVIPETVQTLFPRLSNDSESTQLCLQLVSNLIEVTQSSIPSSLKTKQFMKALTDLIGQHSESPEWLYNRSMASEILLEAVQSFSDHVQLYACISEEILEMIIRFAVHPISSNGDALAEELQENMCDTLIALVTFSDTLRGLAGRLGCMEGFLNIVVEPRTRSKALEAIEAAIRDSVDNTEKVIACGGLRPLGKIMTEELREVGDMKRAELILMIMNSLMRNSSGTSHARVVGKMLESDFEKTRVTVGTYLSYYRKVRGLKVSANLSDTEVYLLKCEAGLLILQQSVALVIRLFAEPNEVLQKRILGILTEMKVDFQRFVRSVFEYVAQLNDADATTDADTLRDSLMLFQSQAL